MSETPASQPPTGSTGPFASWPTDRTPAGEAVAYRGYTLVPMRETFRDRDPRTRWDVLEHLRVEGSPELTNRVKTCASRVTAEGWVDTYGEPTPAPDA